MRLPALFLPGLVLALVSSSAFAAKDDGSIPSRRPDDRASFLQVAYGPGLKGDMSHRFGNGETLVSERIVASIGLGSHGREILVESPVANLANLVNGAATGRVLRHGKPRGPAVTGEVFGAVATATFAATPHQDTEGFTSMRFERRDRTTAVRAKSGPQSGKQKRIRVLADLPAGSVVQVGKGDRAYQLKVDRRVKGVEGVLVVGHSVARDYVQGGSAHVSRARFETASRKVRQAPISRVLSRGSR